MKHVLFISRGMSYGGSGRCISVFARQLALSGYKVSLLILRDYKSEYEIASEINVIRTHLTKSRIKAGKIDVIFKWFPEIVKYMDLLNPDLVIPFGVDICLLSVVGNFQRRRICVTVRSDPMHEPKNILFRMVRDFIYQYASYIWVQNEQQKTLLKKLRRSNFVTVPNPVRSEIGKGSFAYSGKMQKFITLGRLSRQKNQKLLINVFSKLSKKYEDIILEIYGEGELRKSLEKQIKKAKSESNICLKGRTENALDVLKSADAFILCSDFEGMPNALMEAMALGIPCISTDCNTGPRDLIVDKVNGILIPCNDSSKLYKAIESFIRHPDIAINYGKKAQKTIWQQFDEEQISKRFVEAVERMCKGD